jgi:hypothetical protein
MNRTNAADGSRSVRVLVDRGVEGLVVVCHRVLDAVDR